MLSYIQSNLRTVIVTEVKSKRKNTFNRTYKYFDFQMRQCYNFDVNNRQKSGVKFICQRS